MALISVDKALLKAKSHILKGEIEEAQKVYEVVLQAFPKNKRAQRGLTVLAKLKQSADTLGPPQSTINQLLNIYNQGQLLKAVEQAQALALQYPEASIVWNILGAASKGLGKTVEASKAFKKVTLLNPTYANGFSNLGVALNEQGKLEEAIEAYNTALALKPNKTDAYYNMGIALKGQGKLEEAIESYKKAIALKPDYYEAYNNMGIALKDQGRLDEAIKAYTNAIVLKPDYAQAYYNMAIALQEQDRLEEAIASYSKAVAINPNNAEAYNNMGIALKDQDKLKEAIEAYKEALAIKPNHADAYYNTGNALKDQGKLEEAIESYKKAIALKPDHADVHRHLSMITTYTPDDPQIGVVEDLLKVRDISDSDQCLLHYTKAKINEDLGDLSAAFSSYVAGGALRKKLLKYQYAQDQNRFYNIKNTAQRFKDVYLGSSGETDKCSPIFILGMPRSGTSLVEQIISSHSEVTGAGELAYIGQFGGKLAEGLIAPTVESVAGFREHYLVSFYEKANGKALITDKMPQNFLYIALICAAFPEAKIVHVERNAAATCWSNFKHYFSSEGLGYSYNLRDTVKYYGLYKDLMYLWYQTYSARLYNLDYDMLTENLEPEIRRLITYLELDYQDACLAPQNNKRTVRTASQLQVGKEVYKGSSQAWHEYRPFLGGVFDSLESQTERVWGAVLS